MMWSQSRFPSRSLAVCAAAALMLAGCESCPFCGGSEPANQVTAADAARGDGAARQADSASGSRSQDSNVISLFDGKTLGKWKPTKFGGEGEVEVKDGQLIINYGESLSGVTWQGEPPARINYEISLEAMRLDGNDFFVGLTVPVKQDPISLIVGGWGGGTVGLSSLNGFDASENETSSYHSFKSNRWYKIRLRVMEDRIQAWIDKENVVDVDITDKKIGIRWEVELSVPLGISTFQTTAAFRNIKLTKLTPEEQEKKE